MSVREGARERPYQSTVAPLTRSPVGRAAAALPARGSGPAGTWPTSSSGPGSSFSIRKARARSPLLVDACALCPPRAQLGVVWRTAASQAACPTGPAGYHQKLRNGIRALAEARPERPASALTPQRNTMRLHVGERMLVCGRALSCDSHGRVLSHLTRAARPVAAQRRAEGGSGTKLEVVASPFEHSHLQTVAMDAAREKTAAEGDLPRA